MTILFLNDLKRKTVAIWLMIVLISLIFMETFFLKEISNCIFLVLTPSWYWVNKHYEIDARVTMIVGISFLFFCTFFMFFNEFLAMKLAVWAFLLLFCGSILATIQEKETRPLSL